MTQTEKICTACGRSSLNPVSEQHLACCPDNNYVTMSNNKQSSVDFYAEQSLNLFNLFQKGQISMNEFRTKMYEVEIQSTKMHKEEIIISHINGQAEYDQLAYRDIVKHVAEQYYNATFGGNNEQR